MTADTHFDILILGGGPAGTRAAFRSAALGLKTGLVEFCFLGGTCLNVGCIPTKYLLGGTASLPLVAVQKKYKTISGDLSVDLVALQGRKDRYIKGLRQALEKQLAQEGVTLFQGKATFTGAQSVVVKGTQEETTLTFNSCVVATGSVPASFDGLKPDGKTVYSSATLLNLKQAPESLIIVGAGAIGIELGELYHRLGTKIILTEGAPRILPGEDPATSEAVRTHFAREGWEIHAGRKIQSLATVDGMSQLLFEDGQTLTAAASLISVGRRPGTQNLAPEAAGITLTERGWLATNENLQASEHVYAVGDINGRTLLAHAADHQARYAINHILGIEKGSYQPPAIPSCIYGTFEVMRVGPTAAELQQKYKTVMVSHACLAANTIAQSYGHPQGTVSMFWVDNKLHAVSAAGHGVSHLVSAAAMLVREEIEKNNQNLIIFAHPTLDEVLESAMVAPLEHIL